MNRKDRIDLSILMIIIITIISLYTYADYKEERSVVDKEELLQTQANPQVKTEYYLSELSGYVVVYEKDKKTIYEYTNILVEELPENIQIEILNGLKLENLQEVYGFLENYSS